MGANPVETLPFICGITFIGIATLKGLQAIKESLSIK